VASFAEHGLCAPVNGGVRIKHRFGGAVGAHGGAREPTDGRGLSSSNPVAVQGEGTCRKPPLQGRADCYRPAAANPDENRQKSILKGCAWDAARGRARVTQNVIHVAALCGTNARYLQGKCGGCVRRNSPLWTRSPEKRRGCICASQNAFV